MASHPRRIRRIRVFHHPTKPGVIVLAGHPDDDLPPGAWNNIMRRSELLGET